MLGARCLVQAADRRRYMDLGPPTSVFFSLLPPCWGYGAMELLVAEMQLQVRGCVCACAALVWV